MEQYAFTERAAQAAALRDIADLSDPLDGELPQWFMTPDARHATSHADPVFTRGDG